MHFLIRDLFVFLLVTLGGLKLLVKLGIAWCKSNVCLKGKTVIVTGANCGVGYVTALEFAKRGARVILACRNETRAQEACQKIVKETGNDNVVVRIINLASFESVRAFAKDINATEKRLDILVNNAGAYGIGEETVDGLPLVMQVNYFSTVLLTLLLIDLMRKTGPSRVVNVASSAANLATKFKLDDVDKHISKINYENSKLCIVLFTTELSRKIQGTNLTTYSLHPGFIDSEFFHNVSGFKKIFVRFLITVFSITPEEGAQTSLHCALAKGIEIHSGEHFERCRKVARPRTAKDPQLARQLWDRTMNIINVKPNEIPFQN